MKTVAYSNPFVPPEWIAAHNLRPAWPQLRPAAEQGPAGAGRGVCPYAGALVDAVLAGTPCADAPTAAVVLTTACDQMRFSAALLEQRGAVPVFLLNVPSTWTTAHARDLYRDELLRLGRFLVGLGGAAPSPQGLAQQMRQYDAARAVLRTPSAGLAGTQLVEALAQAREGCGPVGWDKRSAVPPEPGQIIDGGTALRLSHPTAAADGIRLALLGGPLGENDSALWDLVEQAGGRIVLDATESGQRTLPAAFRDDRLAQDPVEELADAYFHGIAGVFRRPNDALYEWLARQLPAFGVRGILLRRLVWCDLWHAEAQRLREWSPVPVLDIDFNDDDRAAPARVLGRIEAFLEMLR